MHDFALCSADMRWSRTNRHAGVACTPPHAMGSGTSLPPVYSENERRWKEDVACMEGAYPVEHTVCLARSTPTSRVAETFSARITSHSAARIACSCRVIPFNGKYGRHGEMECSPSWMIAVSVARNPVLAVSIGALNVAQTLY